MGRLIGLVISVGLTHALNPSTIGPALYLASGADARRKVTEFTTGVFAVYLVGGLAIALGPGRLLLAFVPRAGLHLSYVLEIVAGAAMLTASALLWSYRDPPAPTGGDQDPPTGTFFNSGPVRCAGRLPPQSANRQ